MAAGFAKTLDHADIPGEMLLLVIELLNRPIAPPSEMVGFQASPTGGTVHVEVRGDRVILGGGAVIVARGELSAIFNSPALQ